MDADHPQKRVKIARRSTSVTSSSIQTRTCGWVTPHIQCQVARLRDDLLPMAERFHRMAEAGIEALRHQRREPSVEVERAVPVALRVVCPA